MGATVVFGYGSAVAAPTHPAILRRARSWQHAPVAARVWQGNGTVGMASLVTRTRSDGGASYRVVWRKSGGRSGPQAGETFAEETQAAGFKLHVDAAGNDWPVGWTPGQGWVAADDGERVDKLLDWGSAWIVNLTRPSADAKDRYTTRLTTFCEQVVAPVHAIVPTVQSVTEDHVVRRMMGGRPTSDRLPRQIVPGSGIADCDHFVAPR